MSTREHISSRPVRRTSVCLLERIAVFFLIVGTIASPALAQPSERVEIIYWHKWTGYWKDMIDEVCTWFNESQDGITVKPLVVPGESARTKFLAAVVGGDPPDLMSEWDPVVPHYAASGLIMPLDKLIDQTPGERERIEEFLYPVVREMATYEGHLYALGTCMNTYRVFYSVDAFEEAEIEEPPRTIAELESAMDQLFVYDAKGYIARAGFELGPWQAYMVFPAFGGYFFDETTKQFDCVNPNNLAALRWMCQMGKRYGMKELSTFNLATGSYLSGATDPFASGRVTMRIHGQWNIDIIDRAMEEGLPEFRYDTFAMPPGPGGPRNSTYANGNFNIIPVNARHPEEAWEFMKWLTGLNGVEAAARINVRGGWIPVSREVADTDTYQAYLDKKPAMRPFVKMLSSPHVAVMPLVPIQSYFNTQLGAAVDYAMWGVKTPEEALRDLQRNLQREYKRVTHDLKIRAERRKELMP